MTTRRGSQYSIQKYGDGFRSKIDPSKGNRKGQFPSGTESKQGSARSQRQVPEIPIISDSDSELSINNSNRYKSHSEGSDRHINKPLNEVIPSLQAQRLENVSTNKPRSDKVWEHP
ncbi:hypothetical protein O181_101592 [Austropuccinia psidii MF-1]|uniref:Uncharacterized protein n=1 Tax=Austropuccinia psidii MF-1 TaxID=1389203 RepID=A0A9Q3PIP2_9BASI|nr:hypothetical protein [Austropuccinia psidii MF-1]